MTQGGLHSLPSISTLSYPLYLHTLLPSLYLCSALCLSSISTRYYPLYIPSISTLFDPFQYSVSFSPLYLLSFFLYLSPLSLLSYHSCVPSLSLIIFYLHSLQSHLYLLSPFYLNILVSPLYPSLSSIFTLSNLIFISPLPFIFTIYLSRSCLPNLFPFSFYLPAYCS